MRINAFLNRLIESVNKRFLLFLSLILFFYLGQSFLYVIFMNSWLDEGNYLVRSYWYVTGKVKPYSSEDATWYMPFYFYILGFWQKIFGPGHYSGRLMSVFFGMVCMTLILLIGKELYREKWQSLLALSFFTITPWAVKYFSSATPYAIVSCISLLLYYVIIRRKEIPLVFFVLIIGILFCALFFLRNNMILGIMIFLLFMISSGKKKSLWVPAVCSVLVFCILTILLLHIFPSKLTYYTIRLPFIRNFIHKIPTFSRYALVEINTYKGTKSISSLQAIMSSLIAFLNSYVREYLFVLILSLVGFFFMIKYKTFWKPIPFSGLYFLSMSILHFIGSQGYCKNCIRPYTNYFYVFGCIGSIYTINCLRKNYKKKSLIPYLFLALFSVSLIFHLSHISMLLSKPGNSYVKKVIDLSEKIEQTIPSDEKVLVIGGIPYTTQALFYAKRDFEITSIFQNHFHRKVRNGLSEEEKSRTLSGLREMSWWSDEMMESWIRYDYDYIITDEGHYFKQFSSLIEQYFILDHDLYFKRKLPLKVYKRISNPAS